MSQTPTSPASRTDPETRTVPIAAVHKNTWNVNRMTAFAYAKLLESIREYGNFKPLLVRQCPRHADLEIIGGEHRHTACVDLGHQTIDVVLVDADDAVARKLSIIDNELHGQADPDLLAGLMGDLLSEMGDDLLVGLPFPGDVLAGLLGSPAPLPAASSAPGAGAPSGAGGSAAAKERWVERTYRMPQTVAEVLDEALARARGQLDDGAEPFQALEVVCAEYLAS